MTLDKLLATLEKQSITLKLEDGKIAVPKGMLTDELRLAIIANKLELIKLLQTQKPADYVRALDRLRGVNRDLAHCSIGKLHIHAVRWRELGMDRAADIVDSFIDTRNALEVA